MSGSDDGRRSPLARIGGAIAIFLLLVLGFAFFKIGIVVYGEPMAHARMVWKPSPGKVFFKLDFPKGATEGQVAALCKPDPFYLDYPLMLKNTFYTIGDDEGAFQRAVVTCFKKRGS